MNREQLIEIIFNDTSDNSCPEYACEMPELEGNTGECCRRCAEKQLAEYEEEIRKKVRKVDKTKESNIKCEHCIYCDKDTEKGFWCCIHQKQVKYYNRCKCFKWEIGEKYEDSN